MAEVKRLYYDSGVLKEEWFEINSKYEGEYKRYFENGQLWIICNYVNGKRQ